MTEEERKHHEIDLSIKVRTTLRKLLVVFVLALSGGAGIGTGFSLLTGGVPGNFISALDTCTNANKRLSDYAAKCHAYIGEAEKELHTSGRPTFTNDIPEQVIYSDPLEKNRQ